MWAGVWLHAGLGVLRLVGMCGLSGVCVCGPPGAGGRTRLSLAGLVASGPPRRGHALVSP